MTPVPPIPVADQSPLPAEPIVPTVRIRSRPVKSTGLPIGTDGPTTSVAPGDPEGLGSGSVADNSPFRTDAGILSHPEAGPTGASASSRLQAPIAPTEMTSSRDSAETPPPMQSRSQNGGYPFRSPRNPFQASVRATSPRPKLRELWATATRPGDPVRARQQRQSKRKA